VRAFAEEAATRAWPRLRTLRNRGFEPRLRHRPDAAALILSPHPDDAVIDCWSVLTGRRPVDVVNVFAGMPRPGELSYYDRLAGACDSAGHMRRRISDDRGALRRAGRVAHNLPFLARGYRRGGPEPSFAALDAAIAARTDAASSVYAPAALGAPHPDHELVRAYALRLADSGMPVWLYADLPYSVVYGWPAWVNRATAGPSVDVDGYWRASAGEALALVRPELAKVVRLPAGAAAAKLAAMRAYGAEFALLDRGPLGQLSNPSIHSYEVFWPAGARQR
jgi:LmbE family N-acetylglucosaminyl deacetylase